VAITFYCARCGTRLELDSRPAGGEALCPHCHATTRVPAAALPFARIAAAPYDPDPQSPAPPVLVYRAAGPDDRYERSLLHDVVAERLRNVVDDATAAGAMTSCSYCGTTIARYIKKCPSCRHPLWGI